MRQSEIQVGKVYTNGKGGKRKVVRIRHNVHYAPDIFFETISGREPVYLYKDGTSDMTLRGFARWAKAEVKEAENG